MSNIEELEGKEFIVQYGKYNPIDGCVEIANRQPLVRCKDCAFFFEFKNHDTDLGDGYCDWLDKYVGLDKYCAYGMERRIE